MEISLEQAAAILNRSEQEVLYIANNEGRLPIAIKPENDMVRNEDGTVQFVDATNQNKIGHFNSMTCLSSNSKWTKGLSEK